jgi:hypothetical protein
VRCDRIEAWKDGGGVKGQEAGARGRVVAELLDAVVRLHDASVGSLVAVVRFPAFVANLPPPPKRPLLAVVTTLAVAVWLLVAVARPLAVVEGDERSDGEDSGLWLGWMRLDAIEAD